MTEYPPIALANTFVQKYGQEGIEHMKLQKLCYFAHGWWLAFKDSSFLSERPQVWKYGPVFNSLYHVLSPFGSTPIIEPQKISPFSSAETIDDDKILELVDWIWKRYSHYSSIELSEMTHEKGTPWRQIAEQHRFQVPKNYALPDDVIREFFKKEAAELRAA